MYDKSTIHCLHVQLALYRAQHNGHLSQAIFSPTSVYGSNFVAQLSCTYSMGQSLTVIMLLFQLTNLTSLYYALNFQLLRYLFYSHLQCVLRTAVPKFDLALFTSIVSPPIPAALCSGEHIIAIYGLITSSKC